MPVRSCKVTIQDMDGTDHTVTVTASSLYEAVALGIASIRTEEWVAGIPDGLNAVRVTVTNVPVEHTVKMSDFTQWIERNVVRSPRDRIAHNRVREILGLSTRGDNSH